MEDFSNVYTIEATTDPTGKKPFWEVLWCEPKANLALSKEARFNAALYELRRMTKNIQFIHGSLRLTTPVLS